ncbi:MAG TPA: DUF4389 domain-containing protein [Polyangia bacterium]
MHHPVNFIVAPPAEQRPRAKVFFRPLLALPHLLLVGGPAVLFVREGYPFGVLGAVAALCAFFDWIAIVVTGSPLRGLDGLKRLYLRWRARTLAYSALLRDEYPPFDDGDYPATLELPAPPMTRDRIKVLLRPFFALPHLVVVMFLSLLGMLALIVAWAVTTITGRMPPSLWRLGRDITAYSLRTEAYLLLIHDEFPPFALSDEPSVMAEPAAERPLTSR